MNRLLGILFFSNFVIVFVGMGLFPILPLYAAQFGASTSGAGLYLAIVYIALAAGTILASRPTGRLSRRGAFIAAGTVGIVALILLGQARTLWQVVVLTAVVWFCGGVGLSLTSVFTGLISDSESRGKSFSVMATATPLGALIGGTVVGRLVASQGYPLMFAVLGFTWIALPVVGLFFLNDRRLVAPAESSAKTVRGASSGMGVTFHFLLLVTLLSAVAIYLGRLGTSLSMQALDFTPSAIASTATVSGLIAVPMTLLIGVLSDRLGRKRFLMLGYGLAAAGVVALGAASQLWHFWVAASLTMLAFSVTGTVSSAFATDVLAPETLSRGLPWLNTMNWIAAIVSFAGAGYVVEALGTVALCLLGLGIAGAATIILSLSQENCRGVWTFGLHHPTVAACM